MNPNESKELLRIVKNIQEMLHEIVVLQAEEKGKKHSCEVCFDKKP